MSHGRIAYIITQYPVPSHSFIRREIAALESLGLEVVRFAIRRWPGELVDPSDLDEKAKTQVILESGLPALGAALFSAMFRSPKRFARAMQMAIRMGRSGHRGIFIHLIYLLEACRLLHWVKSADIGHVHAHFGTNSTAVAMLCKALGGPSYSFTVHGSAELDYAPKLSLDLKIEESLFTVAASQYVKSQLCRWSGSEVWRKIKLVRCGVDRLYLEEAGIPAQWNTRFVCIARLVPLKGLSTLLEAIQVLALRGIGLKLTIIGDGPQRDELQRMIRKLGLRGYVELAGWRSAEQIRAKILESRAVVLPSFSEGLPVVLMEALALGRPVIATWIGGVPELVKPGINGWLVPPGCAEALADAILACYRQSPDQLALMGQAGREMVVQKHDCNAEAGKLARLFCQNINLENGELVHGSERNSQPSILFDHPLPR